MIKKLALVLATVLSSTFLYAQTLPGGITAKVVDRAGRAPIKNAAVAISLNGQLVSSTSSAADGQFLFENLENGIYAMTVKADGYSEAVVNVTVEDHIRDLIFVSLVAEQVISDIDDTSFAEFDMEDSGYSDNPAILYGANDPYNSIVSYGFSDIRFKNRGYNSESQDVLLAGVRLNDAVTGYSPYSLWSGLNEAMRSKETTTGLEGHDIAFGSFNGVTNILGNPSSVRPGWRFSLLSNSALYRLRLMANYASGVLDNGWSFAFNVSARLGGNDWVKGVYYRSLSYYAGAEKKIDDRNSIAFFTFAAPGSRGAQNSSTQEVYDLVGDNMYNSNWGYQNGVMRNARVRTTFEPVFVVKYKARPLDNLDLNAAVIFRTGMNGYSAFDWYDSADPRPDYYRNLPSYYYDPNPDLGRNDLYKHAAAAELWATDVNCAHVNWDHLYNINYNSADGRSKYIQQSRRTDQNDLNLALSGKWMAKSWFTLNGGVNGRYNRTEFFETAKDLLGGKYFLNINNFAERDFAFSEARIQYDLDYWLKNGRQAEKVAEGGKYGYDYYAHVREANVWANGKLDLGSFKANLAAKAGFSSFWREGLMRNGLFPGLDPDGKEYVIDGVNLTSYDDNGKVISSFGKSEVSTFMTGSVKTGLEYDFTGGHRVYANAGWFMDAPRFNQAFLSPRTRNTLMTGLTTVKTLSADLNYQYSNGGCEIRATAFWTKIMDQSDLMSFYDDSFNSFTNFAMTGIDQRHEGIEVGFKIPMPFLSGLSLQGALSAGEYIYTSTPVMTQTIDNSSETVVKEEPVTYWAAHPIYKKNSQGEYVTDDQGNYILDKVQKHYVPSTPQIAANIALNYRTRSYWFFTAGVNIFAESYLDMNPLYRTEMAVAGPDDNLIKAVRNEHRLNWFMNETVVNQGLSPIEIEYMAAQEKLNDKPLVLANISIGKSWYINRQYNFGFSLEAKNLLNNKSVKTGGYEQTRLIDSESYTRYYRFDSKYFYMQGANYMLNLYFRF